MAIKIINKKATKPIFQGECNSCGCLFEFEHSDAITYNDSQIEGFSYYIACPNCNKKIWVNRKILRYEC